MKVCARSALCWLKLRPKADCQVPFGNRNNRPDKFDGSDPQFTNLKKELTLEQKEISNLKNQLHQAKQDMVKERAERDSKSKKDDSPDEEVGGKRVRHQAKRAKAAKPGTSPPSTPWKDSRCFRLVTTVTRRRKMIIRNRMPEQHTPRQSLLAFNQSSRRRLYNWRLSLDLQGQEQGKL